MGEEIKEQTFINKGFVSHDKVFDGLDEHPDGTLVLWNDVIYWIVSNKRSDGVRQIGLEPTRKFIRPKRNEPCWCGSEKKYKKCCWKVTK